MVSREANSCFKRAFPVQSLETLVLTFLYPIHTAYTSFPSPHFLFLQTLVVLSNTPFPFPVPSQLYSFISPIANYIVPSTIIPPMRQLCHLVNYRLFIPFPVYGDWLRRKLRD